jgi:catechol 2,3-dioxygenase-like lactoylglutathione lyase family enzyme
LIRYIRPAGRPARARSGDPGSCHIALRVDDLDAAVECLQGSQARQISRHPVVLHDPGGPWDGVACCYIADPDGNIVELVQRPSAEPQQLPS